jgi:hypothetical protein
MRNQYESKSEKDTEFYRPKPWGYFPTVLDRILSHHTKMTAGKFPFFGYNSILQVTAWEDDDDMIGVIRTRKIARRFDNFTLRP